MKLLCLVGMRGKSAPRHTELSGKYLEPVTFALCLFHRLYVVGRCFLLCSCSGKIRAGSLQCGSLRDRQHEKTGPELDKLKDTRSVTHKVYIHVHVYIYIYIHIYIHAYIYMCVICSVLYIQFLSRTADCVPDPVRASAATLALLCQANGSSDLEVRRGATESFIIKTISMVTSLGSIATSIAISMLTRVVISILISIVISIAIIMVITVVVESSCGSRKTFDLRPKRMENGESTTMRGKPA